MADDTRWLRANQSEYEQVLKRFKKDVDIKKIKTEKEFQAKVTDWAKLKKHQGEKLANAFMEILTPPKVPRRRRIRRVAAAEIIPKKMEKRQKWSRHELAILRYEKRRGRGYAKRVAKRLEFERSLKSIYMKSWRL